MNIKLTHSLKSKPDPEKVKVLITQSYPTLCHPMDCNPPGSSVHEILQARIVEWVTISFSRESSWLREWSWVSLILGRFFTIWARGEAPPDPEQALNLFSSLKGERTEEASEEMLEASRGWFMWFKGRIQLHNIQVQGEAANAGV